MIFDCRLSVIGVMFSFRLKQFAISNRQSKIFNPSIEPSVSYI